LGLDFFGDVYEFHGGFVEQRSGGDTNDIRGNLGDAAAETVNGEFFGLTINNGDFVPGFLCNGAQVG
jgi:hypothetical protein